MFTKNKHNKGKFVPQPDFLIIGNLYDTLYQVTKEYGFEKVILHLGQVAKVTLSRGLAGRIWGILHLNNRVDPSVSDTTD